MTDATAEPSTGLSVQEEDEAFYHESALNAAWTGTRLAIGGLTFLFGCFAFAYFYLRSLDSSGRWEGSGYVAPTLWLGTVIMLLAVLAAGAQYFGLQRIKAGHKDSWAVYAIIAMVLAVAAIGLQVYELNALPFLPGSSGYASVFVSFYPVFTVVQLAVLLWLEILFVRARRIPAISFVEQPPTIAETRTVQRFQAGLSAFTAVWNYLAFIAVVFWFLFYIR